MIRRRKLKPSPLPDGWVVRQEFTWNGRHLRPGTEVSITGERGARFRFVNHTTTPTAEWIEVVGGPKGVFTWRCFRPERIRRVHRKRTKMTTAEAAALIREKKAAKRAARPTTHNND